MVIIPGGTVVASPAPHNPGHGGLTAPGPASSRAGRPGVNDKASSRAERAQPAHPRVVPGGAAVASRTQVILSGVIGSERQSVILSGASAASGVEGSRARRMAANGFCPATIRARPRIPSGERRQDRGVRMVFRSLGWPDIPCGSLENGIPFAGMARRRRPSQQTEYSSQTARRVQLPIPANGIPFSSAVATDQTVPPATAGASDCASGDKEQPKRPRGCRRIHSLNEMVSPDAQFDSVDVAGCTVWPATCRRMHSLARRLSPDAQFE